MGTSWLKVDLNEEEERTLLELGRAPDLPQRTKDRAHALRLSHRGWSCKQIARYLHWQVDTVRNTLHRWRERGLAGLWDAPRQGRPPRWQEQDLAYLEETIEQDPRTFNSQQLVEHLQQQRQVQLSRRHLRRVLKKRATAGSVPVTVIVSAKTPSKSNSSKPI